jgi:hypothetical protein
MDDFVSGSDQGSAAYIQAKRIIRIETPLGADVLLPERCEVREGVNALFEIHISVRSKKTDILPADIVGKLVDVSLELDGAGKRRPWNGLVTEMHEGPAVTRASLLCADHPAAIVADVAKKRLPHLDGQERRRRFADADAGARLPFRASDHRRSRAAAALFGAVERNRSRLSAPAPRRRWPVLLACA